MSDCSDWDDTNLIASLVVVSVVAATAFVVASHFLYKLWRREQTKTEFEVIPKWILRGTIGIDFCLLLSLLSLFVSNLACQTSSNGVATVATTCVYFFYCVALLCILIHSVNRIANISKGSILAYNRRVYLVLYTFLFLLTLLILSVPVVVALFGFNSIFRSIMLSIYIFFYLFHSANIILLMRPLLQIVLMQRVKLIPSTKLKTSDPPKKGTGPISRSMTVELEEDRLFETQVLSALAKQGILAALVLLTSLVVGVLLWVDDNEASSIIFSCCLLLISVSHQSTFMFWGQDVFMYVCGCVHRACVRSATFAVDTFTKRPVSKPIVALPGVIEANRTQFIQQSMVSQYFLAILGCRNSEISDDSNFSYGADKLEKGVELLPPDQADETMNSLVETVIKLVGKRLPLSEDLLVLAIIYCNRNNRALRDKLMGVLQNVSNQCINPNISSEGRSELKKRDQTWFKNYLLNANVWIMPRPRGALLKSKFGEVNDLTTSGVGKKSMWFDMIDETVDQTQHLQRVAIRDAIRHEKKEYSDAWSKILLLEIEFEKVMTELDNVRQDDKRIGILPEYSALQLEHIKKKSPHYDGLEEYNSKNYLTKCLIIANLINQPFQKDMQDIFCNMKIKGLQFQAAPVKLESRCIIKANTDYVNERFPSVANICDFVRCSVTVENTNDMLEVLKNFAKLVKSKKAGCVTNIVRIKNGFSNAEGWQNGDIEFNQFIEEKVDSSTEEEEKHNENVADSQLYQECKHYKYFDLKLSVIIEDSSDFEDLKVEGKNAWFGTNGKICMIGEIQFLLKSVLSSKKMGHFGYSVGRKRDYFEAVHKEVRKDGDTYQSTEKLSKYCKENKYDAFCRELILKPSLVSSVHNRVKDKKKYDQFCDSVRAHYQVVHDERLPPLDFQSNLPLLGSNQQF